MNLSFYIKKYKILFPILKLMSLLLPYKSSNWLASRFIKYLNPRLTEKAAVYAGMESYLPNDQAVDSAWKSYTSHIGIYDNQTYFYGKLTKKWLEKCVEVKGREHLFSHIDAEQAVLVMIYHQHHTLMLFALFGLMDCPSSPIAMDPKVSPLYPFFPQVGDTIYGGLEKHFSGGKFIYIKPGASYARPIFRALAKHHAVFTANDFPDPFSAKRRKTFPFLNSMLDCPTGSIEIALKKNIPIVSCYLKWIDNDHFQLVIQPIDAETIDSVMTQYLLHLEDMIKKDPGLWEGWKWLKVTP
ncbi:Uncharacterised protein [Candidatus Venteria ishoeyi]|uniref:Lipid A biosynthesis lauroyl acyltransferase n=2 Tax=Candidatus Venteria ishoeyi TaxID=1899563 RepID=A0A1H6FHB9_9GAMM|nr:Uncharacterised protein [Candidatus Venteria ishoeyi]